MPGMRTLGLLLQNLGILLFAAVVVACFWVFSLGCDMGSTGCRTNPVASLFGFLLSSNSLWIWIAGIGGACLTWLGSRLTLPKH